MKITGDAVSGAFGNLFRVPVNPEAGDYKGADGLWYCGKCRTRKQKLIRLPPGAAFGAGGDIVVACQCKCQEEAYEKKKADAEYQEEMQRIKRRRDASMMESKYLGARFSAYQTGPGNERAFRTAQELRIQVRHHAAGEPRVLSFMARSAQGRASQRPASQMNLWTGTYQSS